MRRRAREESKRQQCCPSCRGETGMQLLQPPHRTGVTRQTYRVWHPSGGWPQEPSTRQRRSKGLESCFLGENGAWMDFLRGQSSLVQTCASSTRDATTRDAEQVARGLSATFSQE